MSLNPNFEPCPVCASDASVREKLVLIDDAWLPDNDKDPREAYFADLRVDDLAPNVVKQSPLHQFVDGFFCEKCGKGFVSENSLKESQRRYR
jgi:hypothetical protein